MEWADFLGLFAGLCTTAAVIPQIIKAYKTKQVKDISPVMFAILLIGVGLWVIYGIIKNDFAIITTNALSLILNIIMMICMFKYRST